MIKTLKVLKVGIFLKLVWNGVCQRLPQSVLMPPCSLAASIKGRIYPNILPYPLYLCRHSFIQRSLLCHLEMGIQNGNILATLLQVQTYFALSKCQWKDQSSLIFTARLLPAGCSSVSLSNHVPRNVDLGPPWSYFICPKSCVRTEHDSFLRHFMNHFD